MPEPITSRDRMIEASVKKKEEEEEEKNNNNNRGYICVCNTYRCVIGLEYPRAISSNTSEDVRLRE